MSELTATLITLGGIFLLGSLADLAGRMGRMPRVSVLLVLGMAIGPMGLDWVSPDGHPWLSTLADMALALVGFLLGQHFTLGALRQIGRPVLYISVLVMLTTVFMVIAGFFLTGVEPGVALLLAGIATATDPAAVVDVIKETRSDGPFTRVLLGVVAVDDAWGLIAFSLLLAAALALSGGDSIWSPLIFGLWEIGGACLLGGALGLALALVVDRLRASRTVLAATLGTIFLGAGLALLWEFSFLLTAMSLGTVTVNLSRKQRQPFLAIEKIIWPLLIFFFVFAGVSFRPDALAEIGFIGVGYVVLRTLGRFAGGWLGAVASGSGSGFRDWMGLALLPQAGIALGMAFLAVQRFPEAGELILPVVIASTLLFEVVGPLFTRMALTRVGETGGESGR